MPENIEDIVLACINRTRPKTPDEIWADYQKTCVRSKVVPIYGQFEKAVKRAIKNGKIKVTLIEATGERGAVRTA